jgi:predicted secreted protein
MSKSEAPGVNIPWGIGVDSPQVQYADERGLTGRGFSFAESVETSMRSGGLPKPFISMGKSGSALTGTPASTRVKGSGPAFTATTPLGVEVGMGLGYIPKPFMRPEGMSSRVEQQTGALPLIGEVPFLSPFISNFQPMLEINTKVSVEQGTPTTVARPPYTIGDTTFYESITTSNELTTRTETSREIGTPVNMALQQNMPVPGSVGAEEQLNKMMLFNAFVPGLNMLSGPIAEFKLIEMGVGKFASPEQSKTYKSVSGFIPLTPQYFRDMQETTYEDPTRAAIMAGVTMALVGTGTALRSAGFGTKILAEGSRGQVWYSGGSKILTGTLGAVFANDVAKRVTGVSISELQGAALGKIDDKGMFTAGSAKDISGMYQKNFQGIDKARKQINILETQELIPMMLAYSASQGVGDKVFDYMDKKGVTEILPNIIRKKVYFSEEGFPTNPKITTQNLAQSFTRGEITLNNPGDLLKSKMNPLGTPIKRIPIDTQEGAPAGKIFAYTGQTRRMMPGVVGESASEVTQVMYLSPEGLTYFTKPGTTPGGFGMSNDIFGLYRDPSMQRIVLNKDDYQYIPKSLTNMKNPTNPTTGKPWSINDPYNPKMVRISQWVAEHGEYGKLIVGQYGKSEWQGMIRTGTEIKTSTRTGFYEDAGRKINFMDVTLGGKAKGYTPRTQFEIGKFYATSPGVSSSGVSSNKIPLVSTSLFSFKPADITTKSYTNTNTKTSRITSSKSPPISSSIASTRASSPFSSTGMTSGRSSSKISSPFSSTGITSGKSSGRSSGKSSISSSISNPYSTTKPSTSSARSIFSSTPAYTTSTKPSSSTTSKTSTTSTTETTTTKTPFKMGFPDIGGSGAARPFMGGRLTRWQRDNPVADMPYLSRGLGGSGKTSKKKPKFSFGGNPFG